MLSFNFKSMVQNKIQEGSLKYKKKGFIYFKLNKLWSIFMKNKAKNIIIILSSFTFPGYGGQNLHVLTW